jgi:hypothetical protein
MRYLSAALAAAVIALLAANWATAVGPPSYDTEEAYQQDTDLQGHPTGPPIRVNAADHRPSQADLAGTRGPRVKTRALQTAAGCRIVWAQRNHRSIFGNLLWTYRQTANFCWNAVNTITGLTRSVSGIPYDALWKYDGTTTTGWWYTWCCSNPSSGHYGWRRGKFHNEEPITHATLAITYPVVEIWVHGDSSWAYRTACAGC